MPELLNLIRTALLPVIVLLAGPAIAVKDVPCQVLFANVYIFDGFSGDTRV